MKIKDAIIKAREQKRMIKNESFKVPMLKQDAKSLIHWLFVDAETDKEAKELFKRYLKSDTWELED